MLMSGTFDDDNQITRLCGCIRLVYDGHQNGGGKVDIIKIIIDIISSIIMIMMMMVRMIMTTMMIVVMLVIKNNDGEYDDEGEGPKVTC